MIPELGHDPARVLRQNLDDRRELIMAGYPVLRRAVDRPHQPQFMAHAAWTRYRPSPAFWIGVLIGLLAVGFVLTMT